MIEEKVQEIQTLIDEQKLDKAYDRLNLLSERQLEPDEFQEVAELFVKYFLYSRDSEEGLVYIRKVLSEFDTDTYPINYLKFLSRELEFLRRLGKLKEAQTKFNQLEIEKEKTASSLPTDKDILPIILKSYVTMAQLLQHVGETEASIDYHHKILDLAIRTEDSVEQMVALNNLGTGNQMIGKLDDALTYYQKAFDKFSQLPDSPEKFTSMANTKSNIASVLGFRGQIALAIETCLEAVNYTERIEDKVIIGIIFTNLGNLYIKSAQYEESKNMLERAIECLVEVDAPFRLGVAYSELLRTHLALDNYETAKDYLEKLLDIAGSIEIPYVDYLAEIGEALILWESVDLRDQLEARDLFEREIQGRSGNYALTALAYKHLIEFNINEVSITGNQELLDTTADYIKQFRAKAEELNAPIHICEALILEANMDLFVGNLVPAMQNLEEAANRAEQYKLHNLGRKIQQEQEKFDRQYQQWNALINSDHRLRKRIEKIQVRQTLTVLLNKYG